MIKIREVTDPVNGYVLPKFLIGFGLWHIAIEQSERGSLDVAMIIGILAICALMEALRLIKGLLNSRK